MRLLTKTLSKGAMDSVRKMCNQSVHDSRGVPPVNGYDYNHDANDDASDNERKDNTKAQNDENKVAYKDNDFNYNNENGYNVGLNKVSHFHT